MNSPIRPLRPHASVPPIPMGCLTALLLLPIQILFLPVTLIGRLLTQAANRSS